MTSWAAIEQHYIDLNNHGWGHNRLLELVRHIKSSDLSKRLFAYTSLDKLIITIYETIEPKREALHIEFDRELQKWSFKYYSKPDKSIEFERQYKADMGIEKFESFIKIINW